MAQLILTKAAKEDLKAIGRYTQDRWGREQRNHYLRLIDQSFYLLVNNPELGVSCSDIQPRYRKHSIGSHLIFYRIEQTVIQIVRILHKRMDVESQL